jgi:excisionase family DNA binding protein
VTTTDDPDIPVLPYKPSHESVLTVYELARALRVGERSAYLLVASGQIRSVRVGPKGRGIRIPRAALDEFLAGENSSQEVK